MLALDSLLASEIVTSISQGPPSEAVVTYADRQVTAIVGESSRFLPQSSFDDPGRVYEPRKLPFAPLENKTPALAATRTQGGALTWSFPSAAPSGYVPSSTATSEIGSGKPILDANHGSDAFRRHAAIPGGDSGDGVAPNNFSSLQLVTDTTQWPYSPVVKIFADFLTNSGTWARTVSSGTLVNGKTVITAGHCIYAHEWTGGVNGGFADEVWVVPGYENLSTGAFEPFGSALAVDLSIDEYWSLYEDFGYDVGWITLHEPIGLLAGWQGLDSVNLGGTLQNPGYPANSPYTGHT